MNCSTALYARLIAAPSFPNYCDACDNLADWAIFRENANGKPGGHRYGLACAAHLPADIPVRALPAGVIVTLGGVVVRK